MAAASNMLAGAGYGSGSEVQDRADDIYEDMNEHFGNQSCGWADTALTWWLGSANNTYTDNPYTIVAVYHKVNPRYPWANPNLPAFVGNELRKCNMVRLSIRKPTCDSSVGQGGHAITLWGDEGDANELVYNPNEVIVSDSDYFNWQEDRQTYEYDDYNNPNPGGCNEGDGWYIDYWNSPHWYIDNIVTLSPTTDGNTPLTQKVITSTRVQYNPVGDTNATDLHYTVLADANIYCYAVTIDWDTDDEPNVTEDDVEHALMVVWDLSDNPVPKGTWVTLHTELVLAYDSNDNSAGYNAILWTPINLTPGPGLIGVAGHTSIPGGFDLTTENMCGGTTVCSCSIYTDQFRTVKVGEYRWQHEYKFFEDPEQHDFVFLPPEPSTMYWMGDFKFGHSYGQLLPDELWAFEDWMTTYTNPSDIYPMTMPVGPFNISWPGQLPYPQGQDYKESPQECGDEGTVYLPGDVNKDCKVDFIDLAYMGSSWLVCTDPQTPDCW
jgi:hypothetical protein